MKDLFLRTFSQDELDELVYEAKADEASSVNNSGTDDQWNYLRRAYGDEDLQKMLSIELCRGAHIWVEKTGFLVCTRCGVEQ